MVQAAWLPSALTPHLWGWLRENLRTVPRSRSLTCWWPYPGDNGVSVSEAKSRFLAAFQGSPRNSGVSAPVLLWPAGSMPCRGQAPFPGVSPGTRLNCSLGEQVNLKAKLLCFHFCEKMFLGLLVGTLMWAQVSTGTLQTLRGKGQGSAHQMGKPGASLLSLRRVAHLEGQSSWLVAECEPTKWALCPQGPGESLLGRPLRPWGFVQLAIVKQGSNWALFFQVRLLGNVSFRVLLLGEAKLGPGLALRAGCSQGSHCGHQEPVPKSTQGVPAPCLSFRLVKEG